MPTRLDAHSRARSHATCLPAHHGGNAAVNEPHASGKLTTAAAASPSASSVSGV